MDTRMTGNPHGLLLYDYGGSPCARRVRISLMEKGLDWETQKVDLSRMEQRHPDYLAINPNGLVPTLAHGERVLWESNVITQYLDDVFPLHPLYPDDPWELAQVRNWQAAEQAMARDYRPLLYQRLIGPIVRLKHTLEETLAIARQSTQDAADLEWEEKVWRLAILTPAEQEQTGQRLYAWLDKVEQALEGGRWLVGDRFSQAEISIYPRVAMYPYIGLGIDRSRYPRTLAWMKRLQGRASFARTLTKQDKGLLALARTGVLPWLGRVIARPPQERSLPQKLGLRLLKRVLLRAERADAPAPGEPRVLRKPSPGAIPPAPCMTRVMRVDQRLARQPYVLCQFESAPEAASLRRLLDDLGLACQMEQGRFGEPPVLRHGRRVVQDPASIAEYLALVSGDERWFPRDAHQLARARMWLAFDASMQKDYLSLAWGKHARESARPRFDRSPEQARALLRARLEVIEAELAQRPFLLGPWPCFADLALHARIATFSDLGIAIDAKRLPGIARWMGRLRGLAAPADERIPAN